MEQEEREPMATKDGTETRGREEGIGISSLPRKRKYRYLSGVYALVLRVTSAPFKYHQWLRELPLPLTVLGCQSARGARARVRARRRERDGTSDRSALEKGRRGREESRRVAGFLIPSLWVTKAQNPPLVLPPRSC